jgi:hypothetical protein
VGGTGVPSYIVIYTHGEQVYETHNVLFCILGACVSSAAGLITSEAYALLRFNTEYLLKKLSEE